MSLDDNIKSKKRSAASSCEFCGRGRESAAAGTGPTRRIPNLPANRAAPYSLSKVLAPDSTKLYISNLECSVTDEDIKVLFSEVGDLKRHSIHYDRRGRLKGTAEVVFSRRADALAAVKRYNNIQLDGKPMKIEIVGTHLNASCSCCSKCGLGKYELLSHQV